MEQNQDRRKSIFIPVHQKDIRNIGQIKVQQGGGKFIIRPVATKDYLKHEDDQDNGQSNGLGPRMKISSILNYSNKMVHTDTANIGYGEQIIPSRLVTPGLNESREVSQKKISFVQKDKDPSDSGTGNDPPKDRSKLKRATQILSAVRNLAGGLDPKRMNSKITLNSSTSKRFDLADPITPNAPKAVTSKPKSRTFKDYNSDRQDTDRHLMTQKDDEEIDDLESQKFKTSLDDEALGRDKPGLDQK